jgi:hypothetical protein
MRICDADGMLSPASIAAFSTGPAQAGAAPTRPVQRVRSVGGQPAQPTAPVAGGTPKTGEAGTAAPSRILPRGSLLDLSV